MEKTSRMETVIQFTSEELSEALQRHAKDLILQDHAEAIRSGSHVSFLVHVDENDHSAKLTIIS